jgi:DNA-binding SARP family transcriptional activator
MPLLAINLLGHFEVTLDGQPVPRFRTDKMRALLAYLAVEAERDHRRAMLAGLLWPEFSEADARHNLSQTLFRLRQLLGKSTPPFFLATRQTLRLNPASDITVDVAAFQARVAVCGCATPEQLSATDAQAVAQAVACYRGEFLSTPLHVNSQAFEEWLLLTRAQLHVQALDALDCLGQYHEQRGEYGLAVDYARRQIELDPLREAAHRRLMDALARDNRRAEALAHYTACQTLLAEELGIAPAPETTALYERIQAARSKPSILLPQRRKKPGTGPLVSPPPFVGRARELATLDEALSLALTGRGQVRFVTGDAGSGKTALLEAFAQRALAARADLLVTNGRGNAYTGSGDPYWPFIEMLEQLCASDTYLAKIARQVSDAQTQRLATARPIIRRLIADQSPDLPNILGCDSAGTPRIQDLQQDGLSVQMTRVLHAVAAHYPLVLMLDDAQWADPDSLNLMFHLGRQLTAQRILIIGAFRADVFHPDAATPSYLSKQDSTQRSPSPSRHPLVTLVNELQRHQGGIQIDLAQASGRAFIDALVDSEPNHLGTVFRDTLYRHTGGQALFTTELLQGMQTRGDLVRDVNGYWVEGSKIAWDALPARVEGVIAERVGQLLPDWQAMLAVASVEGDEFTVQVVARVLDISETEVSRRLSGALARHHI